MTPVVIFDSKSNLKSISAHEIVTFSIHFHFVRIMPTQRNEERRCKKVDGVFNEIMLQPNYFFAATLKTFSHFSPFRPN